MRGSSYEAIEGAGRWKDAGRTLRKMGLIPNVHVFDLLQNLVCTGRGIKGGALDGRRYLCAASALLLCSAYDSLPPNAGFHFDLSDMPKITRARTAQMFLMS